MTTLKDFFDRHIAKSNAEIEKVYQDAKENRRLKLGLSEKEFELLLLKEDQEAKDFEKIEQDILRKKHEKEKAELANKRSDFAMSLGHKDESFHLAELVSIRYVNEFSGGSRRTNVVHVIKHDRSLLCKQKKSGSTALSSDWVDNIELKKSNITCERCLKKTI